MERIWQFEFDKVEQRCAHLLTSTDLSDCTFVVGSELVTVPKKFEAHKLILAMASPVFQDMFYELVYGGRILRVKPNIPMIPDVQPEVFGALLEYIYTGNPKISSFDMAWGLLDLAGKYRLPHLEQKCYRYICSVLSPRNVCRAYELACLYEETLKEKCIQLISKYTKMVLSDDSFKSVELNTMITIFSLNHLSVDSELDLFNAVAKYAGMEQMMQGQISPKDEGLPSEPSSSQEKVSLTDDDEIRSSTCPVTELDSKTPTEVVTTKPITDKENLKEEGSQGRRPIRAALEKIRFLTLTPAQFAKTPATSGLLTVDESFAVLMNIASKASGEPMPTGFSQSREPRSDSPDEDDDDCDNPRPKPSTEVSGVAATQLPTAAEIVRGLLPPVPEAMELEHAARAARQMTCADAYCTSVNLTQLVEAGGIPPLVAALDDPRSGVQYDAAWAITNIACDDEYAEALVKAGAVRALARLLDRGGAVAELAAWALGNLAFIDGESVVYYGVKPLLAHMLPTTPSPALRTYVRLLRIISESRSTTFRARAHLNLVRLATPCIENLLVTTDEQVLADACWAVYRLPGSAKFCNHPYTSTLAARVTALLGHAAPRVQLAALGAMNTILDLTELRDICFKADLLDHIINLINCGNSSLVKKAVDLAPIFLDGEPLQNQEAVDKRILDALEAVLTEGNDECKLAATFVMCGICDGGSASQLSMLAEGAALEPFYRMLDNANNKHYVYDGLAKLLERIDENKRAALILKLRELGLPQRLNTDLRSEYYYYGYTDKTVEYLLDNYFSDDVDEHSQDTS